MEQKIPLTFSDHAMERNYKQKKMLMLYSFSNCFVLMF